MLYFYNMIYIRFICKFPDVLLGQLIAFNLKIPLQMSLYGHLSTHQRGLQGKPGLKLIQLGTRSEQEALFLQKYAFVPLIVPVRE